MVLAPVFAALITSRGSINGSRGFILNWLQINSKLFANMSRITGWYASRYRIRPLTNPASHPLVTSTSRRVEREHQTCPTSSLIYSVWKDAEQFKIIINLKKVYYYKRTVKQLWFKYCFYIHGNGTSLCIEYYFYSSLQNDLKFGLIIWTNKCKTSHTILVRSNHASLTVRTLIVKFNPTSTKKYELIMYHKHHLVLF